MIPERHGSCHCGAVRFRCRVDLAPGDARAPQLRPGPWFASTLRCNCSWCRKTRIWKAHVPAEAFTLVQGRDALSHYRFGSGQIDHCFCSRCGVTTFCLADFEEMGGAFACVNLACLDDVDARVLAEAPLRHENGADDDWDHAPAVVSWL